MFLKEFAIRRYGPLADSGKRLLGSFNLFYGPNEDGKTLTIDALLKMLFGKVAVRYFDAVKRVEEKPEGYLIIETGAQKEVKLPETGTISDLSGISIAEFSNIFVIRDSDLAISEESDFYRGVTNRLTGIRSDEIRKIKERLCELGRITAGGEFKNTEPDKLKDRLKKVQLLLEKIEPIPTLFQEEGFSRFEEELARHEENNRETTAKLNQLRAASHRERYEKGRRALELIQKALVDLSELKPYNQVDYETWQRAESSIEHLQNDQSKLEMEITANKETLSETRNVRKTAALAYKILDQKLEEAFKKIEPLFADYDQGHLLFLKREILIKNLFLNRVASAAILVILLSLTGLIIRPSLWLFIILSVSALLTVILGLLRFSLLKKKSRLGTIEARACIEAEKLGLSSGDIHAVRSGLGVFKSDLNLEAEKLKEAENEVEWQQKALERLTGQLEEKLRLIMETEVTKNRMRQALSIETLAKFKALLKRQQVLNNEIDNQKSLLESHFGQRGELHSEEGRLNFWQEQVEELSQYSSAAPDLKYDQTAVLKLNEELEKLEETIKELKERMKERYEKLHDIEKEANELLHRDKESHLPCQTTLDLEMVQKKLQEWVDLQEDNKNSAVVALEIFTELEEEEEQKVTALFGQDSPVSSYFSKITGGCYREVRFESRDNPIIVVSHDGVELAAANLSGGTYDQLYFAIRMALGEKLLDSDRGFFILDDPFIKADPVRLKALISMLLGICDAGWQILYFSAKGEVKEALQDKIAAGEVREFSIK